MAIHQIQTRYDELRDRILLRVSTTDESEFQFWLTRRFVRHLWGLLVKMLEQDRAVRQQVDPDSRREVLGIQHEGFAQQGDFSTEFENRPYRKPLGEAPVLLAKGEGKKLGDGSYLLRLHPREGQGIDMALDTRLLHLFTKLLNDAVAHSDWDINLALHQQAGEQAPAETAPPRKLN